MKYFLLAGCLIAASLISSFSYAESVYVELSGMVNTNSFECTYVVSSVVDRVCYERKKRYMLISLRGRYYHYCDIDASTVKRLITAPSIGSFFNQSIRSKYDCRPDNTPSFQR